MKQLFFVFCITFFCYFAPAQEEVILLQEHVPEISGKLIGFQPSEDADLLLQFTCVVPTPEKQEEISIKPNPDGSFRLPLVYPIRYQQVWFRIGEYYFGKLIANKGLYLIIDLPKLKENPGRWLVESVHYSDSDAELNQFINQYTAFEIANRTKKNSIRAVLKDRSLTTVEKCSRLREIYNQQKQLEERFSTQNPSPFAWILANERNSEFYGNLFKIHWGKDMPEALLTEALLHRPKIISNSSILHYYNQLYIFLTSLDKEEKWTIYQEKLLPYITIPDERKRLENLIEIEKQKVANLPYDTSSFREETKYFQEQYRELLYAANLQIFAQRTQELSPEHADIVKLIGGDNNEVNRREQYLKILLPTMQNSIYADMMEEDWQALQEKIDRINNKLRAIQIATTSTSIGKNIGTLPNGAQLIMANEVSLDTLLASIRSAYPNHAIILDIWATWCRPCIYDMQQSTQKLKALSAAGVQVIYFCVSRNTTIDNWQKQVADLDLPTKHIYLGQQLSKEIMSYFGLSGYPSYVFLDSQGKYHPGKVHAIRSIDVSALKD